MEEENGFGKIVRALAEMAMAVQLLDEQSEKGAESQLVLASMSALHRRALSDLFHAVSEECGIEKGDLLHAVSGDMDYMYNRAAERISDTMELVVELGR
jgi:hypothetical protein